MTMQHNVEKIKSQDLAGGQPGRQTKKFKQVWL